MNELGARTVASESGPREHSRHGDSHHERQHGEAAGAQQPPPARQHPEPQARERARKHEEHLLRAHDGRPEAEAARQEPAEPPPRQLLRFEQAAQQEPEPAQEEGEGEHVGPDLEGLEDDDRQPRQK